VVVANEDGTEERKIAVRRAHAFISVDWSPDGKSIASVVSNSDSSKRPARNYPPDCAPLSTPFAYSALACFRIGMSGSASFQRVRKSL